MALRGCQANERRMRALGYATLRYRLAAYVLSAMLCGVAGVLLANLTLYVSPSYLAWTTSGELIVMVALGGMGTLFGPVAGALAFLLLEEGLAADRPLDAADGPADRGRGAAVAARPVRRLAGNALASGRRARPALPHRRTAMSALRVEHLLKRYGGLTVTDDLSLEVRPGELHAVIGPNGAGKTTLIGQLSGELRPDGGRVLLDGVDVTRMPIERRVRRGLARSYQITSVFKPFTALENVAMAVQARGHSFRFWRPRARRRRCGNRPARRWNWPAWAAAPMCRPARWRMASCASWSWPWCWPAARPYCCWMNPWRA